MEYILKDLNQNPFFLSILALFTVLGFFSTVFFYFKSIKRYQIKYMVDGQNIYIDSRKKISNIKVLYKNEEIPNLTLSKFYIFNFGNDFLGFDSVSIKDSMRLEVKNSSVKILESTIIYSGNSSKNIEIEEDQDNICPRKIKFDFIPPKDGFVIQITHSGTDVDDVLFLGKTKDDISWKKADRFVRLPTIFMMSVVLLFYFVILIAWTYTMGFQKAITLVLISLAVVLPASYLFPDNRYKNPSMPSQFRKFFK